MNPQIHETVGQLSPEKQGRSKAGESGGVEENSFFGQNINDSL